MRIRRRFANPFVITLVGAGAAACSSNPPSPVDMLFDMPLVTENPPPPIDMTIDMPIDMAPEPPAATSSTSATTTTAEGCVVSLRARGGPVVGR